MRIVSRILALLVSRAVCGSISVVVDHRAQYIQDALNLLHSAAEIGALHELLGQIR